MTHMTSLYLFDDAEAHSWSPFALTRPVGEMLFGALLQRERLERALGRSARGYLVPASFAGFEEAGTPPLFPPGTLPEQESRILLSTRYVPASGPTVPSLLPGTPPLHPLTRLVVGGETAGWILGEGVPLDRVIPLHEGLLSGREGELPVTPGEMRADEGDVPAVALPGTILRNPWNLVEGNADRLREDLPVLFGGGDHDARKPTLPEGVVRIGEGAVTMDSDVRIDPSVVLDTRTGPIHLATGVQVRPFTTLTGPAYIGPGSILLGGVVEATSCGPVCRLRGEVSSSVLLGYTNKAHDGYLGHALVGRWVNLGAFTTNSDLKNNYGPIRVATGPGREVDTGLMKVGVLLGDHVKTGIGTLMGAGTVVGAGSNLFGGGMAPKWVPPFTWNGPSTATTYLLDAFVETAARAMGRRGVDLTPGMHAFLSRAWHAVCGREFKDAPQ